MDMPPIHMCFFLTHENERLKVKIVNLKRHITHLEQTIAERNLDHVHSCSISCQTDIDLRHSPRSNPLVKLPSHEQTRLHHLLKVQNDLLRKYENENQSSDRREFLSNGVINDYERRLIRCEKEKQQAEQRAIAAEKRMEKFEERYQRMKREIGSLDENFFEEIEDLKFALQQANNLNREYEKTVQILSNRLGIPYPTIANQRK